MKPGFLLPLLLAVAGCVNGCASYAYRVVKPPGVPQLVAKEPVTLHDEPLDYGLARRGDRLGMRLSNPTDDQIVLVENGSYVVDPQGESHPIRGKVLAPHSYIRMRLPPVPQSIPYPYANPPYPVSFGWGFSTYDPFWYYDPFYWPPPAYYQIITPYDWQWKSGLARLHLAYERAGKPFTHDFEIVREREK